jgi:LPS O-antigen subunit length determinant protein (WzzB/FepE family)
MMDLQNESGSQQLPATGKENADIYEDEINLADYLLVLWKRKYLILLGSVLPVLIVGLILFFSPRNYKATYVYDVKDQSTYNERSQNIYNVADQSIYEVSNCNLDEKDYTMFLNRFYSAENTSKIVTKMREERLNKYAERISTAGLNNFVTFDVSPPYIDLSQIKLTDPIQLEKARQLSAQLLNMTIISRPRNDLSKISLVIRDNLENVIPLYMVEEQLHSAARRLRAETSYIKENNYELELVLKTNKTILDKLKKIKTSSSDNKKGNIALQFDISGKTEYLPVEYQVQAVESKIIQLEEKITATKEKDNYYKKLLALNEKLFAELKKKASSYYTIQQFHSFLSDLVDTYPNNNLKDYLASYIKRIENRISVSVPASENPEISSIAKGITKKSVIVFIVALMMSVSAGFLMEGLQKSKTHAS